MILIYSTDFSFDLNNYFHFFQERGKYEGNIDLPYDFSEDLERAIKQIQANPEAWPKITKRIRKIHLSRFKNHSVRYQYHKGNGTLYLLRITHSAQNI